MKIEVPTSIKDLALSNEAKMSKLGITPEEIVSIGDAIEAGEAYLGGVLTNKQNRQRRLNRVDTTKPLLPNQDIVMGIMEQDPGLLLIRPEMFHHTGAFVDFLVSNDFQIVFETSVHVDINMYWKLSKHVLTLPGLEASMPTRTMTYTDQPTSVLLFIDPARRYSNKGGLANGFSADFRGVQAIYSRNTIRGDVVYSEAKRLRFNQLKDETIALATDPMRAIRQLIHTKDPYHDHIPMEDRTLQYNRICVHIPNGDEINRDITVLLSRENLLDIRKNLIRKGDPKWGK